MKLRRNKLAWAIGALALLLTSYVVYTYLYQPARNVGSERAKVTVSAAALANMYKNNALNAMRMRKQYIRRFAGAGVS